MSPFPFICSIALTQNKVSLSCCSRILIKNRYELLSRKLKSRNLTINMGEIRRGAHTKTVGSSTSNISPIKPPLPTMQRPIKSVAEILQLQKSLNVIQEFNYEFKQRNRSILLNSNNKADRKQPKKQINDKQYKRKKECEQLLEKLKLEQQQRLEKQREERLRQIKAYPPHTTKELVERLRNQLRYYAVVEICGRAFLVTAGDLVITNRLKDVNLGDVMKLNRVRELGSKDFTIKGQPLISERFCSIKARVVEQPRGPQILTIKKKKGNPRTRHIRHKQFYTVLRICEVEMNKL
ncbi:hypothetical protein G9A89_009522 [Geosiphon pyriformis]|nr:hypothetical protein G9A89_009522 [Geosiphon pyriformis]